MEPIAGSETREQREGAGADVRTHRWLAGSDPQAALLAANWLVLIVVRALPGTPPHDGVRLFLPSFAFLAALTGVAVDRILVRRGRHVVSGPGDVAGRRGGDRLRVTRFWDWAERPPTRRGLLATVLLLYAASATSLFWYWPQGLSYYNLLIGGLRGAASAGMEPTYYWDALDRSVLAWLDAHTAVDEKIAWAAGPRENLDLMREWGLLRRGFRPEDPGRYRWYVVQCRPSAWSEGDRRLVEQGTPAFCKVIRPGGLGPWRLDVPLILVFPANDVPGLGAVRGLPGVGRRRSASAKCLAARTAVGQEAGSRERTEREKDGSLGSKRHAGCRHSPGVRRHWSARPAAGGSQGMARRRRRRRRGSMRPRNRSLPSISTTGTQWLKRSRSVGSWSISTRTTSRPCSVRRR